ncbi:hypothetical protein [Rhodococcus sp. X156]|uniref:hypothetical protein n=1 Tax=Rhodococcus sp. X156 TaxID=2499145 RepID=UPI000FD9D612|nr:hypothetical protein [Rhodococcus sp. X156]
MTTLPPVKRVKDILDGLLGRDVTTRPGTPLDGVGAIGGVLATYVNDTDEVCAVAGWDLPAAAGVGAALGLYPAGTVREAVHQQHLPQDLFDALSEVSNVLASAFQLPGNPHLRLERTYRPVAAAPPLATSLLYSGLQRLDLDLDVPGYGPGRLSVAAAA